MPLLELIQMQPFSEIIPFLSLPKHEYKYREPDSVSLVRGPFLLNQRPGAVSTLVEQAGPIQTHQNHLRSSSGLHPVLQFHRVTKV